ncbi:hypothetical protein BpHYR1_054394 [Brachionus plicatilis]|uniref:Uncharacterized protein n=1 Tax=Brachionus plicatilis TaxID=10195 RepID=A0A3M7QI43_BRAPC|nr:hypothetical protein BpHYR1_054394 [Brachionus plicatilis]
MNKLCRNILAMNKSAKPSDSFFLHIPNATNLCIHETFDNFEDFGAYRLVRNITIEFLITRKATK